jgi:hypothetical protein
MQTLFFLSLAFLPPLISGPLPSILVLRFGLGENWRRHLLLIALLTIILNLGAAAIIIFGLDDFLPPGAIACSLTPIVAIVTLIISLRSLRRIASDLNVNPVQGKWLQLSLVAISTLQILMVIILIIIAPALCNTGIRDCPDY